MLFNGTSIIKFHCVEKTQPIYLQSKDLLITKIPVGMKPGRNVSLKVAQTLLYNDQSDFMEILFKEPLERDRKTTV